jgi:hypothetical protein
MEAEGVLIQRGAECIAIAREVILKLDAGIRKESKDGGVGKVTPIDAEEFVHLRTFVGDLFEAGVHVIDNEDHFNRSPAPAEGLERVQGKRDFVIQDSEVLLQKSANGRTGFRKSRQRQGRSYRCQVGVAGLSCRDKAAEAQSSGTRRTTPRRVCRNTSSPCLGEGQRVWDGGLRQSRTSDPLLGVDVILA